MSTYLNRGCGVLMPVFSLPSQYGIGSFSKEAYDFVDILYRAKQKYWQILPLNPIGKGDSPYQSTSTFAGNPLFIDIESISVDSLLLEKLKSEQNNVIEYEKVKEISETALRNSFKNAFDEKNTKYQQFVKKNSFWLEDYSLFMALKKYYDGKEWIDWEEGIRLRKKSFCSLF